jgi:hypothetical protein
MDSRAQDSNHRAPIRFDPLIRAAPLVTLTAAFTLSLCSCAKQESAAERDAVIDRRVAERLEAAHQAEERQRLAKREDALEAREQALAAQERSFAAMMASIPREIESVPADTDTASTADSYSAADSYSPNYADLGGQIYPEEDDYVSADEPYVAEEPYFFAPTTYVTIINQNATIVSRHRNPARTGCGPHHPWVSTRVPNQQPVPRQPSAPRKMPTAPRPMASPVQTIAHRPTQSASTPQVVNRRPIGAVEP